MIAVATRPHDALHTAGSARPVAWWAAFFGGVADVVGGGEDGVSMGLEGRDAVVRGGRRQKWAADVSAVVRQRRRPRGSTHRGES